MPTPIVNVFPEGALTNPVEGKVFVGVSLKIRTAELPAHLSWALNWTRDNLGRFDLLIGDYLNRHNYEAFDGATESGAIEHTTRDADHASKKLRRLISANSMEGVELISAAVLCKNPDFLGRLEHFERRYRDNHDFRLLIDQAVDNYLRRTASSTRVDQSVRAHCVAYQLEELVLFELLVEKDYRVLVYAGAQLPVMRSIASKSLSGISRVLEALSLVELRFARAK
jgi:tRNA-dependent cyclodipeptide synthase